MLPTYAHVLTTVCALASTAAAVTPIKADGKDFVDSKTGDRFQIIGVDYQPGDTGGFSAKKDPLSDPKTCLRDAALMQRLGVNTIRVYNLSPKLNHDECASIFNAAGIYMILDVNSPLEGDSLDRTGPESSYNAEYFKQVFGVIEGFKDYPNTLAFFSGNEVINEQSSKNVPAYIRAVQRDMKDYIAKNAKRSIPVGYSAADVRQILMDTVNYFQCEIKESPNSRADFFGLNSYSWCGDSDFHASGYDVLTEHFTNATLPVFFSEYGCNAVEPRYFSEVDALYSEKMSQAFSGGLVYEYTQEQNDFGLVKIKDNGDATLMPDFENLRKAFGKLDMDRIRTSKKSQVSAEPVECSPDLIQSDDFLKSFDIPERPGDVQAMIEHGCDDAKTGKLVDVKKTDLPWAVLDHNGREVKDIKFHHVTEEASNKPDADASAAGDDDDNKPKDDKDQGKDDKDQSKDDKEQHKDDKDDGDNKSHSAKDSDNTDKNDKDNDEDDDDKHTNDDKQHSENNKEDGDEKKDDNNTASESPIDHSDTKPEYYAANSSADKTSTSMSLGLLSGALAVGMLVL